MQKMKVKEGYELQKLGEEYLVLPIERKAGEGTSLLSLNGMEAVFWNLLKEERTAEELVEHVFQEYDVEREILEADVQIFLEKLEQYQMLNKDS